MNLSDGQIWSTLGEVLIRIEAGKSFQSLERPPSPGEYAVLKVSAISWSEFNPNEAKALPSDFEPPPAHIVRKGDFLLSRSNTKELVGAAVIVKDDHPKLVLSDKSLRLVLDPNAAVPEYVLLCLRLREARSYIEANASGASSSMRNLSQDKIRGIPLPLPQLEVQKRICGSFSQQMALLNRLINAQAVAQRAIEALPAALLRRAFTGEV